MKSAPRAGSRGFTLIELLVVVAIIAVLISILLPSLSAARSQAKQLVCLTNLKAQGEAAAFYRDDHRGIGVRGVTDIFNQEYTAYGYSVVPYLGQFDGPRTGLWRSYVWRDYEWELPFVFSRTGSLQCPSDPVGAGRAIRALDYVSNATPFVYPAESIEIDVDGGGPPGDHWTEDGNVPPSSYRGTYRLEEFVGEADPSRTVFVTEAHESLSATSVAANLNTDFRYLHFFLASHLPFGLHPRIANDLRHPGGINSLFFDGHAATMRHDKFDPGFPRSLSLRMRYVAPAPEAHR